ncbi:MAG: DUF89 family protein [Thermoguttaceae bacterium]|nr:DUF89 family protein [Thermoguttaceae bacterium]
MPASLDCVICLLKQSLDAARFATDDLEVQARILEASMKLFVERGLLNDPPRLGTDIHRIVREITNSPDPYYSEKKRFNAAALGQWERFKKMIASAPDPFEATVKLAIAGNSIDFALGPLDDAKVEASIASAVESPLNGSITELRDAIADAKTILYLADNAGEIVLDKLLVEALISDQWKKDVTFVVRGGPIINDALLDDAEEVGITALVPTIGNGSDGLGVIFETTSEEFNAAFKNADLVIAKGLANYETLGEGQGNPKKIAFLFKAKCPFISRFSGTTKGDLVVRIR